MPNYILKNSPKGKEKRYSVECKLNISDFKGKCKSKKYAAAITTAIGLKVSYIDGKFNWSSYTYFFPNKSCFNSRGLDSNQIKYLLSHEEFHVKIAEIQRRKFNYMLDSVNKNLIQPLKTNVAKSICSKIYSTLAVECSRTQKRYDLETNHGSIEHSQTRWADSITNILFYYKDWDALKW